MEPSARKPIGVLAIVLGLAVYGGLIANFGAAIATLPTGLEALVYLVLGVAWLLPLRPLLVWMNK